MKRRLLAMGDIHEQYRKMCEVLKNSEYQPERDDLVLLGDYGESDPVVEKVRELVSGGAVALRGNFEHGMLMEGDGSSEYLSFAETLPYWHERGGFVFVHAGLRPGIEVGRQNVYDLVTIRDEYILGYRGPHTVVTGHTTTQDLRRVYFPEIIDENIPVIRERQIFLDTGARYKGLLTVMDVRTKQFWQA